MHAGSAADIEAAHRHDAARERRWGAERFERVGVQPRARRAAIAHAELVRPRVKVPAARGRPKQRTVAIESMHLTCILPMGWLVAGSSHVLLVPLTLAYVNVLRTGTPPASPIATICG